MTRPQSRARARTLKAGPARILIAALTGLSIAALVASSALASDSIAHVAPSVQ